MSHYDNYNVYFDNYFTTIHLQAELKTLGIFTTGTARTSRLVDLNIKSAKDLSKKGRGTIDHHVIEVKRSGIMCDTMV